MDGALAHLTFSICILDIQQNIKPSPYYLTPLKTKPVLIKGTKLIWLYILGFNKKIQNVGIKFKKTWIMLSQSH